MASLVDLMIQNLQRLRAQRGWTQEEMAEAMRIEQGTLSLRLSGKRGWNTMRDLEAALEAAGIDPAELVRPLDASQLTPEAVQAARLFDRAPEATRYVIPTLLRQVADGEAGEAGPPRRYGDRTE